MTEFTKPQRNPFTVQFARGHNSDGNIIYRTSFWMSNGDVECVETVVDEAKARKDGIDTPTIVDSIKAEHYNLITEFLHKALIKSLGLREAKENEPS